MTILQELEAQLGNNIHVLRDALDLHIRQGDTVVAQALQEIGSAWEIIAVLCAAEAYAKKKQLTFSAVHDGNSVTDSLFHYASEWFPHATAVKEKASK